MTIEHFVCDKCGLCCKNLKQFGDFYKELDDGTGVCIHFNSKTNLCGIYDQRPLKCRVEEGYLVYFQNDYTYEEYIRLTKAGCHKLKQMAESETFKDK